MKAIVVGGGISGAAAAIGLASAGVEVELFDRADPSTQGGFGLGLGANAVLSLAELGINVGRDHGIGAEVTQASISTRRGLRFTHLPIERMRESLSAPTVCVHRRALIHSLYSKIATLDAVTFHPNSAVESITVTDGRPTIVASNGATSADLLIGADGINSTVRGHVLPTDEPKRYSGYACWMGISTTDRADVLREGETRHFWAKHMRVGLHDAGPQGMYWWVSETISESQAREVTTSDDVADVLARVRGWHPTIAKAIEGTSASEFRGVVPYDRKCVGPWFAGPIGLTGDAAHAMMPSLAQGASQGIVDGRTLYRLALEYRDAPEELLAQFDATRRPRLERIVDDAYTLNGIEHCDNGVVRAVATIGRLQITKKFSVNDALQEAATL